MPLPEQLPAEFPFESYAVTAYEVIAEPPVSTGAVKVTTACPFPRVAVTPVGASGFPAGVAESAEIAPLVVPVEFVAETVNV